MEEKQGHKNATTIGVAVAGLLDYRIIGIIRYLCTCVYMYLCTEVSRYLSICVSEYRCTYLPLLTGGALRFIWGRVVVSWCAAQPASRSIAIIAVATTI